MMLFAARKKEQRLALRLRVFFILAMTAGFTGSCFAAETALERLSEIPVQHGGRVKPFESFAREAVLYVTGRGVFKKIPPSLLVWQWISQPEKWNSEPLIPVGYPPLAAEFGVKVIQGRVSPEIVLEDTGFQKKAEEALALRNENEKLSLLDQKRLEVYDKASFFRSIGEGTTPGWIARPENPAEGWIPLQALTTEEGQGLLMGSYPPAKIPPVLDAMKAVLLAFRGPAGPTEDQAVKLSASLQDLLESRGVILPRSVLQFEMRYLRLFPFGRAWPCYLAASLIGFLALLSQSRKKIFPVLTAVSWAFFAAAMILHTYGFYLRCMIAGRPPVSNMYESIIWVSWGVAFFSLILSLALRASPVRHVAGIVAALALILAQKFPALFDPSISPLVPVLRSNLWLTIHVLTITLGYGAFALSWGLAHGAVFGFAFRPASETNNRQLCQYTYRAMQLGVILLASGTVLGGVWANYSWGRFWGWDPKETWALIALLGYILVLHGRFAGWLKPFGFAVGAILAFLGVVMAWYGVNFVLAAGLHSYGFGGGGWPYVAAVACADLALISFLAYLRQQAQTHTAS